MTTARQPLTLLTNFLVVQVCENSTAGTPITCAAGWTQVAQIGGANYAQYQHYEADLSAFLANPNSANFAVRVTNTDVGSNPGRR